jgi:hypothetical protein
LDDLSSQNRCRFSPQNRALFQLQRNYKAFPGDRDFIAGKCVTMRGTHFGCSDELQAQNALIFASLDSRATREQGGWQNEVAPRERLEIVFLAQSRRSGGGGGEPPEFPQHTNKADRVWQKAPAGRRRGASKSELSAFSATRKAKCGACARARKYAIPTIDEIASSGIGCVRPGASASCQPPDGFLEKGVPETRL